MRGCALVAVIRRALRAVIVGAVAAAAGAGMSMRRGAKICQGLTDRLLISPADSSRPNINTTADAPTRPSPTELDDLLNKVNGCFAPQSIAEALNDVPESICSPFL